MASFTSHDGARLQYTTRGSGPALVVLPGGPAAEPAYLDGLLVGGRTLVVLHQRGTGGSPAPDDLADARADRLVPDVEALREQLGLQVVDLLAHSAGSTVALRYAERYPDRLAHLVLLTPSARAVLDRLDLERLQAAMARRAHEPWYAVAVAAMDAGEQTPADRFAAAPFSYGRWDDVAQQHARAMEGWRHPELAAAFYADGATDPATTRAALGQLHCPVGVVVGGHDLLPNEPMARDLAGLFADATVTVLPGTAHNPWLDDPDGLAAAIAGTLAR